MSIGTSTRKGLLLAAYGLLILVGLVLIYLALHGVLPIGAEVLLPIAYVVVIVLLVRFQMHALPNDQQPSSLHIEIKFPNFAKALLCLVIAFLWTFVVGSMSGNSTIGNALAVGPALLIVLIGGFYFYRSFPKWFRK